MLAVLELLRVFGTLDTHFLSKSYPTKTCSPPQGSLDTCNFRFFLFAEQTLDMRFPALASTVSPCQYTMVPLQGLALGRPCPLDAHLAPDHTVYAPKGEYIPNGKHTSQRLPGENQVILREWAV